MCGVCAKACEACAAECLKAGDMPCCKECAEACKQCAETWKAMAMELKRSQRAWVPWAASRSVTHARSAERAAAACRREGRRHGPESARSPGRPTAGASSPRITNSGPPSRHSPSGMSARGPMPRPVGVRSADVQRAVMPLATAATRAINLARMTPRAKARAKPMARVGEEFPLRAPVSSSPPCEGLIEPDQLRLLLLMVYAARPTLAEVPLSDRSRRRWPGGAFRSRAREARPAVARSLCERCARPATAAANTPLIKRERGREGANLLGRPVTGRRHDGPVHGRRAGAFGLVCGVTVSFALTQPAGNHRWTGSDRRSRRGGRSTGPAGGGIHRSWRPRHSKTARCWR